MSRLKDVEPLKCRSCSKELLEYWISEKEINRQAKIEATCPFCSEKSFCVKVSGKFKYCGIDASKTKFGTLVDDVTIIDAATPIYTFHMKKA